MVSLSSHLSGRRGRNLGLGGRGSGPSTSSGRTEHTCPFVVSLSNHTSGRRGRNLGLGDGVPLMPFDKLRANGTYLPVRGEPVEPHEWATGQESRTGRTRFRSRPSTSSGRTEHTCPLVVSLSNHTSGRRGRNLGLGGRGSAHPFDKLRANGTYLPAACRTTRVGDGAGIYWAMEPFDKLRANGTYLPVRGEPVEPHEWANHSCPSTSSGRTEHTCPFVVSLSSHLSGRRGRNLGLGGRGSAHALRQAQGERNILARSW